MAIKRIQDFLLNEEMRRYDSIEGFKENGSLNRNIFPENGIDSINLTNITSKWIAGSNRISGIYNLNLHIARGELCAVVGPVGSGFVDISYNKSMIFKCLRMNSMLKINSENLL